VNPVERAASLTATRERELELGDAGLAEIRRRDPNQREAAAPDDGRRNAEQSFGCGHDVGQLGPLAMFGLAAEELGGIGSVALQPFSGLERDSKSGFCSPDSIRAIRG